MNYQQSYRIQEPPRILTSKESVPYGSTKEVAYSYDEALGLAMPANTPGVERAKALYTTDCSMCHGPTGSGEGPMTQYFIKENASPPVDFLSQRVLQRKDGELFWLITNSIGNMPGFGRLLSEEDRWALVRYIRFVQGRNT